jgi:hypothetical protein
MELPPIPFIVGMTRSGTTLLREMFSSHPEVFIPDESQFLIEICRNHEKYESEEGLDLARFVSDLCHDPKFEWWGPTCEEARVVLSRASPTSFSDALRELFLCVVRQEGASRYGDKTPQVVGLLPIFADLFPEARFIHLIRDGRDVALSHLSIESGIDSVEEVAIVWKRQVQRGRNYGHQLGPGRYREVLYEDLIGDTEGVLRSLCTFVELEFDARMLSYYERPSKALDPEPQHASVRLPPTNRLRDWRHQMSRKDIEVFEALAGDVLVSIGYERLFPRVSARARRRARLAQAYVATKGSVRRLLRVSYLRARG